MTASGEWRQRAVADETAAFVALLDGADLLAPVPGCPGWTLLDLVRHTGGVQRWFCVLLRQGVQEPPRTRDVELRLPERLDAYPAWLAAGGEEAVRTFDGIDPDAPMWAWGADPHARFWVRRMLYETLVHRTDAEAALGLPSVIDPATAADGVDEFLVNLPFATPFAPGVARLRGAGEVIRFRATDTGHDWYVRLRADGFGLIASGAQKGVHQGVHQGIHQGAHEGAHASIHAPAADLLLLLYGRLDRAADAFAVAGDQRLLTHWFDSSAF
ncbi:maleylpyruvate isomerase family mycothiol-dependent enzyme [Streptomyces sp. NPDC018584]|uniref:maleylpyruvate isomerase family mycothiol-dependent enzyme n=1 Tax=unclassified Streptomyces TaxID=2593676 RepID=UPI00379FD4F0